MSVSGRRPLLLWGNHFVENDFVEFAKLGQVRSVQVRVRAGSDCLT